MNYFNVTTLLRRTVAVLALLAPLAFLPATASAACNYNGDALVNCQSAAQDWLFDNADNQSYSTNDVIDRVDSVRETIQECWDCAWQSINESLNQN